MKLLSFLSLLLLSIGVYAQDGIAPLIANPDLYGKEKLTLKSAPNTFDSTIVYKTDTLTLPFFDEFSRNKFQKYNSETGDPGLTEQVYYRMLDEITENPMGDTTFTSDKTFRSEYDPGLDTTIIYYYDSTRFLYDDLSEYEPDHVQTYGFPHYNVYDTLEAGNENDTVWVEDPEFIQDSASIFIKTINAPEKLWLNEQAYHNYRFAKDPWSLGVVTFDGLDENGYPYNFGSTIDQENDVLLAKPLDLSPNAPADSIYFSFLYQKEGYGDVPEAEDSLYLEFYSPVSEEWRRVWRTNGGQSTDFQVAHIPVTDPNYFDKGFQFRFINYGSPAGALDHFHIDYVHMRTLSGYQDTLFKDFAVVYPISTLLKDYISVPWKHFKNHPNNKMGDEVKVTVRNGSELTENNQPGKVEVYHDGSLEGDFTLNASALSGGNINYAPRTTYTSYHDFSSGYIYDNTVNDTMAAFDYEGYVPAQFPNDAINDTTFGQQVFKNYYAYDDGTAEKAYGVTGPQSILACKFDAYQPDSLIAIKIHFVPSVVDVSTNLFFLVVWDDDNGEPGNIIYEDDILNTHQPKYTHERNKFTTYFFEDTMKVGVGETFYIGMRQIDEDRLNLGFDMNHDNSDKAFFSLDNGYNWNNTSFPGSVMMRPVVTSKLDYKLGVKENQIEKKDHDFTVYPNPTTNIVNIKVDHPSSKTQFEIKDLNGRIVLKSNGKTQLDISHLRSGIYLVNRKEDDRVTKVKKLVVQ